MKNVIISEYFGKADTSIWVIALEESNICLTHVDGEAIIFPDIYSMGQYHFSGIQVERYYCDESQIDFVTENFKSFADIADNFDIVNTKRK